MRVKTLGKVTMQEFDDINDLNEYVRTTRVNTVFAARANRFDLASESMDGSTARWAGTPSLLEARRLLREGWNESAERITKRVKVNRVQHNVQSTRPAYSVVGGQASVPRYIQGIPTNMVDRRPITQKQKIVIVNKDIAFSASVKPSAIEEEGIKCLQVIQALEGKGYRVKLNLTWCTCARGSGKNVAMRVTVKKPEERMSINKLAFPIAHPSMLRRIGFSWMERSEIVVCQSLNSGYGMPDAEALRNVLPKDELFLPPFIYDVQEFIDNCGY